jgi:hypothetical protein
MRWKLLVLASVTAAVLGIVLWSLFAIIFFGTARELARHDLILWLSVLMPLSFTTYAGIFVYRHTARRRKTQAVMTIVISLLLSPLVYFAAASLLPGRLLISRTYEVRHAR